MRAQPSRRNGPLNDRADALEEDDTAVVRRRIGEELQALRQQAGMSLETAGRASGLSRSFISMVENGTTGIEVSRLIRLANTYGALVADLISSAQSAARPEFVPRDAGHHVPKLPPDAEVEYLGSPSWPIQPFRVRLAPGGRLESLEHPGAEFIHCLAGKLTLFVDQEPYELAPGDTIIIPDHIDHTYHNDGTVLVEVIGCVERIERTADEGRDPDASRAPRARLRPVRGSRRAAAPEVS